MTKEELEDFNKKTDGLAHDLPADYAGGALERVKLLHFMKFNKLVADGVYQLTRIADAVDPKTKLIALAMQECPADVGEAECICGYHGKTHPDPAEELAKAVQRALEPIGPADATVPEILDAMEDILKAALAKYREATK